MRRSLRCETGAARPFHDSTVHYITSCKGPERGAMRRSLRCETGDAVTTGRYDASDPAPFGRLRVPTVIHAARSIPSRYTRRRAMTRRTTPRPSAGGVACRDRRLRTRRIPWRYVASHDITTPRLAGGARADRRLHAAHSISRRGMALHYCMPFHPRRSGRWHIFTPAAHCNHRTHPTGQAGM